MRIAIIEDHRMFREVVRKVCCSIANVEVVGEAECGTAGMELVRNTAPQLIIVDIGLPDIDGFALIADIKMVCKGAKILIITGYCNGRIVDLAARAGIAGFLSKGTDAVRDLENAITVIKNGGVFFTEAFVSLRFEGGREWRGLSCKLSKRETEVLMLIERGFDDGEIAIALQIAETTAKTHRCNLLRKFNIRSTPKLMIAAQKFRNGGGGGV